jgi:hypothetical protein
MLPCNGCQVTRQPQAKEVIVMGYLLKYFGESLHERLTVSQLIFVLAILTTATLTGGTPPLQAQEHLEYLGLGGLDVTSLGVYGGIVAAGTDGNGVFWQVEYWLPDLEWEPAGLEGHEVLSVFPHKSGPIGWAIGAGVRPVPDDTVFFYCSYMGQGFEACSVGISAELTLAIYDLDGFPDPSVCGETFAAGGRALYLWEYGSPVWEPVYLTSSEGDLYTVQAHESAPGVVVAGGGEGFAGMSLLIKSFDFGASWEDISPSGFVLDVDFTGEQAETIFVATGAAVHRSVDGGESWQQVFTAQLPNGDYISEVVIAPGRQRVYIGGSSWWYESPLFFSDDWGDSWHRIPTGMWGEISGLQLGMEESLLFAHRTEGVFRLDLDFAGGGDTPTALVTLYQNHPNPFNPGTTIVFNLALKMRAILEVWDVRGEFVCKLRDEILFAGDHFTTWNGLNARGEAVASGVYIYRLQTDVQSETKRMVLVR